MITSKLSYKVFLSLIVSLVMIFVAGCSAEALTPTPSVLVTSTVSPTNTLIPTATFTLSPEPSAPPTIAATISPPKEVISKQNINQIKLLDSRELAGIPEDYLHRRLEFTPDGHIVVGDYDTTVYVWDGFTAQATDTFDHSYYLWNVAVSPNSQLVASGGESGIIKVWDLKTGEEIYKFTHPDTIWSLAFSPDSSMLASGSLDQSVKLWNLIDGGEIDILKDVIVNSLAFSPDGRLLAIGSDDQVILWDIASNKSIKTFDFNLRGGEGMSGIQGVLFSPDGKMLAAADADNIAMIWEISSGQKLSTIVGRGTDIRMSEGTLAFSPDSKIIATGNDNGNVIFWDVLADKELSTIGSKECIPWDLIFWPDGKAFEIACWNGAMQLWGIP
jgi:WD40 repeat protein